MWDDELCDVLPEQPVETIPPNVAPGPGSSYTLEVKSGIE